MNYEKIGTSVNKHGKIHARLHEAARVGLGHCPVKLKLHSTGIKDGNMVG